MQLEVILAGNRIATGVLSIRDNYSVNKDENGKRKLSNVLSLDELSWPQNLEYRARERQIKREGRRQASEAQRQKGDRNLEREKKTKEIFLLPPMQGKNERQ